MTRPVHFRRIVKNMLTCHFGLVENTLRLDKTRQLHQRIKCNSVLKMIVFIYDIYDIWLSMDLMYSKNKVFSTIFFLQI